MEWLSFEGLTVTLDVFKFNPIIITKTRGIRLTVTLDVFKWIC